MSTLLKFDKIMLLGAGRLCYFGPTAPHCMVASPLALTRDDTNGSAAHHQDFFVSCGFECPRFENVADWMLDLVNSKAEPPTPAASACVRYSAHCPFAP
jgi:hypothetical protein